ncbi:MAG TPA: aldo/keto reductase [Sphingomonas sp.]
MEDNLRDLRLDTLEVVNLRAMLGSGSQGPAEGLSAAPLEALAALQKERLIRHLGVSNVTESQVAAARAIAPTVCVQNQYNLAHRGGDALIDALAADGTAYVLFFPLGGVSPLQSSTLDEVAQQLSAMPMQAVLAWLLRRSPNILLIPGTSSVGHLQEKLAAASSHLPDEALAVLNAIGG